MFTKTWLGLASSGTQSQTRVYPCGNLKGVKAFVEACGDLIADKLEDEENNYGLAFYACGYNGQAQQEFISSWEEEGVAVF